MAGDRTATSAACFEAMGRYSSYKRYPSGCCAVTVLLRRILTSAGYQHLRFCADGAEVAGIVAQFKPDLILLDLHLPGCDGFEVLRQLAPELNSGSYLPVLMLTGDATSESKRGALSLGAKDFLAKPFDSTEVLLRIRNLLETRFLCILLKAGRLTPEELAVIRTHTSIGADILSGGHSDVVLMAETIALRHHEQWSGGGYPGGLAGEDIPLEAQIVALADFFDALTHQRPCRPALPVTAVLEEIDRSRGTHFNPAVVDGFIRSSCYRRMTPTPHQPATRITNEIDVSA